jgi:hypothetical protein
MKTFRSAGSQQAALAQRAYQTTNPLSNWRLLKAGVPIACGLTGICLVTTDAYPKVSVTVENQMRIIRSDGIPDHTPGEFPNPGNPNRITQQRYEFRVPEQPKTAATTTPLGMYPFGVALNGVPFDPGAAEWWHRNRDSGWQYEALGSGVQLGIDEHHAHVQPTGAYHYHGIPMGLMKELPTTGPALLGYAADGFPIYGPLGYKSAKDAKSEMIELHSSYRLRQGTRPTGPGGIYNGSFVQDYEYVAGLSDLDECNGRFGVTNEYPEGTYYYVLTTEFPFVPRCFAGTPDDSFMNRGGSRRPGMRGGPPSDRRQFSQQSNPRDEAAEPRPREPQSRITEGFADSGRQQRGRQSPPPRPEQSDGFGPPQDGRQFAQSQEPFDDSHMPPPHLARHRGGRDPDAGPFGGRRFMPPPQSHKEDDNQPGPQQFQEDRFMPPPRPENAPGAEMGQGPRGRMRSQDRGYPPPRPRSEDAEIYDENNADEQRPNRHGANLSGKQQIGTCETNRP